MGENQDFSIMSWLKTHFLAHINHVWQKISPFPTHSFSLLPRLLGRRGGNPEIHYHYTHKKFKISVLQIFYFPSIIVKYIFDQNSYTMVFLYFSSTFFSSETVEVMHYMIWWTIYTKRKFSQSIKTEENFYRWSQ